MDKDVARRYEEVKSHAQGCAGMYFDFKQEGQIARRLGCLDHRNDTCADHRFLSALSSLVRL